jgi:glycosyltransferase involved in cell wall biosynthesis
MNFSIFLPTFNRHDSLICTFQSIDAQEHDDYKVFIVDRGSEPPVQDIVHRFNGYDRNSIQRIFRSYSWFPF